MQIGMIELKESVVESTVMDSGRIQKLLLVIQEKN